MINIVFICYGNICRSPMAEMIFKDLIYKNNKRYKMYCTSRATSFEETGNDIYPEAKKALLNHNITIEKHSAKTFTKDEYSKYNYIIVMEDRNKDDLLKIVGEDYDNKIIKLTNNNIEDPWYTGNFEKVYNQIEKGCLELFKKLTQEI